MAPDIDLLVANNHNSIAIPITNILIYQNTYVVEHKYFGNLCHIPPPPPTPSSCMVVMVKNMVKVLSTQCIRSLPRRLK